MTLPEKIPITESDHRIVTLPRNDGSTFEDDLWNWLDIFETCEMMEEFLDPDITYMCYWIGRAFLTGAGGVPIDQRRAVYYLYLAARGGDPNAQYMVGIGCLEPDTYFGTYFPKQAAAWLQAAAKQGHVKAQQKLKNMQGGR